MDLGNLGRLMMQDAQQNCEDLAWANELSRVGERLLEIGQPFGPRKFRDLSDRERWVAAYAARAYGLLAA
jgi:hypothetical protein